MYKYTKKCKFTTNFIYKKLTNSVIFIILFFIMSILEIKWRFFMKRIIVFIMFFSLSLFAQRKMTPLMEALEKRDVKKSIELS